jgi:hypothetical protein
MKQGDIVRLTNPQPGEENARFTLLENPEQMSDGRVKIQLICDQFIRPIETVDISEIKCAS